MASARAILALTCAKDEEPERFVVPYDARSPLPAAAAALTYCGGLLGGG